MILYGNTVSVSYRDPDMNADVFTGHEYVVNVFSGVLTIKWNSCGKTKTIGVPLDLISCFAVDTDEIKKEEKQDEN